jgi:hypothetical protein
VSEMLQKGDYIGNPVVMEKKALLYIGKEIVN